MDEHVERETIVECSGEFRCSACGYTAEVGVYGLGYGSSSARWGLFRDRAVRRALQRSEDDALRDADVVISLTRCRTARRRCARRGRAPDGIVEAEWIADDRFLVAVQWHPEWLEAERVATGGEAEGWADGGTIFEAFAAACRAASAQRD